MIVVSYTVTNYPRLYVLDNYSQDPSSLFPRDLVYFDSLRPDLRQFDQRNTS